MERPLIQAGNPIWISSARRGAASEVTAARHDHIAARLRAAGLGALADLGFTGLDPRRSGSRAGSARTRRSRSTRSDTRCRTP